MTFNSLQTYVSESYKQLTPMTKAAAIGGIVIAFYIPYKYLITRKRKTPIKDDYKQG